MSQPQWTTPQAETVSPARKEARMAAQVESSSPAQNAPQDCEPVKPDRENVTGALPSCSRREVKVRA